MAKYAGVVKFELDIAKFNAGVATEIKKIKNQSIPSFLQHLAQIFLNQVVYMTPVDTGYAKSGWHFGREKLSGTRQYIEVVNRVHYIVYLEYGHSKQAPQGMVAVTMNRIALKIAAGDLKNRFEV